MIFLGGDTVVIIMLYIFCFPTYTSVPWKQYNFLKQAE